MTPSHGFGTRAIHAGQTPDPTTGAIMTPIYQTATYVQESPGVVKGPYDYARSANPTRTALEANLASLEGAKFGLCFSSGCAAMDAALHLLKPGDRVLLCDDVYGGTNRLFSRVYAVHGVQITLVDMTDHEALATALDERVKLVWIETPTNPMLKIIDIERVAQLTNTHAPGAIVAVDNTFATPFLQNPLALGAGLVAHSSTKYIGGHSDVVGGALMLNDAELYERLKYVQNAVGAVPGPMDCFLLLRSTKTLHLRVQRHCENAAAIADWLDKHAAIESVIYPGLASHPQHALATSQMSGFGGIITTVLAGGLDAAKRMLERCELFALAESLGGVESLIEHPAIMTHASVPADQRAALGISDGLVRLSVGVEDVDDLIAELDAALA